MNKSVTKINRNLGIELLRLVAMFMILLGHCINHGKILDMFAFSQQIPLHFIRAICCVAVNLYAITTGYIYINASYRWNKILLLWSQVVFYSLGICFAGCLFGRNISSKMLFSSIAPVTSNLYWYLSSYVLLFCCIPLLNRALQTLSKRQFEKLLFVGFILFCLVSWVGDYLDFLPFSVKNGYSPIWLGFLYCVGAYLKVNDTSFANYRKRGLIITYALCVLLTWGSGYFIRYFSSVLMGEIMMEKLFYSYLSPTLLFSAVSLFLLFAKLDIRKGALIKTFGPCTFGVYLLHDHPITRNAIIQKAMSRCARMSIWTAIGYMLLFAIALYILCLLVEYLRARLFSLLRIPQLCSWVGEKATKIAQKIIS